MIKTKLQMKQKNERGIQLPIEFFSQLLQSEEQYNHRRDKQSMSILLTKYTDLVAYFQAKKEPATEYFQAKIKLLLKNVKFFTHSPADKEANQKKMNKDLYKIMETQMITARHNLKQDQQTHQRINRRVNQILADQQFQLDKRIKNSRRSKFKSNSRKNTLSFATLESTPADKKDSNNSLLLHQKTQKIFFSSINKKSDIDENIKVYFQDNQMIITDFSQGQDLELDENSIKVKKNKLYKKASPS